MNIKAHFEALHNNPPAPVNPHYNPNAAIASIAVSEEMENEGYYTTHTREECRIEFARRYSVKIKA